MNNHQFEDKVKASLTRSVEAIDADTRQRLADIRRQSLNTASEKISPAKWLTLDFWRDNHLMPAASLAFCALIAVFLVSSPQTQNATNVIPSMDNQNQVAILELLNNPDELEVLSDPDFYLWADEMLMDETDNAV